MNEMGIVEYMEELRCPCCDTVLSDDMISAEMCFECGESFEGIILNVTNLEVIKEQFQKQKEAAEERERKQKEQERFYEQRAREYLDRIQNATNILVTTCDLKRDYEIIRPVYFQISNKGIFSSSYSKLVQRYMNKIRTMKQEGIISNEKTDWGFLYGEWSVGQNDFEKAFYIATEELKIRAAKIGADAIIGMRQDIDLDTNGFAFFYLQMYGTAVKYI